MGEEARSSLAVSDDMAVAVQSLQLLVAGQHSFFHYDLSPACTWSSSGQDNFELDFELARLPPEVLKATAPGPDSFSTLLPSGRIARLLFLRSASGQREGILAVLCTGDSSCAKSCSEKHFEKLLPAAKIFAECLRLWQQAAVASNRANEAEQELRLAYKVDEKIHGTMRTHASLADLVGKSGRFLEIAYSVLLLPSKRIRISATHSSWKTVNRKGLDKYLLRVLFPRVQGQRAPVIFRVPPVAGSSRIEEQGYQAMVCPVTDRLGNVEGILAQLGRISKEPFRVSHKRFISHIARRAEYVIEQFFDPMTGLMNRIGFEAQLDEATKALEEADEAHRIIYFDLDNLQLINDTFGQEAGDEVLRRFAQILNLHLPKNGVATRLTSDDFAILLTHSTLEDAISLSARIRDDSRKLHYLRGDKSLQATVSSGIAAFDLDMPKADSLTAARIACDSAKDHGRDRFEVYDRDDQSIVRRYDDMNLVAEIQRRLDGSGFQLLAQPIVSLRDSRLLRYEVLLRMKGSDGHSVPSAAFFSAAERYQLMPQIDRWVVSATVKLLAANRHVLQEAGLTFAVNLSGQSLGDDRIRDFVSREIDSAGLPAELLSFELTESAAVSNHVKAKAFITALRERGCKFSLDDFGAGLSSFAYLKSFKVDTLKIDGSFISDITENRISEAMVTAITQVAKVMQLETVAEYVETEEIRAYVARVGVDCAQGHAVGRAQPLESIMAKLREKSGKVAVPTA